MGVCLDTAQAESLFKDNINYGNKKLVVKQYAKDVQRYTASQNQAKS
jgi:hypothetical protein